MYVYNTCVGIEKMLKSYIEPTSAMVHHLIRLYRVFQKCLNGTAKITLAACSLLLLRESCQSGGATHSAVQALMKHSVVMTRSMSVI